MSTALPRLTSLDDIEAAVWQQLCACTADKTHAWRTPVLATAAAQGVDARTIVLREAEAHGRRLVFYTDARSAKAAHLRRQPEGVLVMWSQVLGWQLRCRVVMSIETSGLAVSSRWARIRLSPAAQDYLSPLPPGSTLDTDRAIAPPDPAGRDHFAVVTATVQSLDWLELHRDGHRRALFDAQGARWVQP